MIKILKKVGCFLGMIMLFVGMYGTFNPNWRLSDIGFLTAIFLLWGYIYSQT